MGGAELIKVVTNNPRAREWWKESESNNMHVLWRDGGLLAVLTAARDLIHAGWRLINHPLSTSIKPNQTPYKTLILVKGASLDYQSLMALEGAIAAVRKFGTFPGGTPRVIADLQLIDLEMCKDIQIHNLEGSV